MSRRVLVYKLRAALVSFSVFLCFVLLLAALTYYLWYPDYLFWLDGGIQGLRLVYAVDIVLGPLLTLVFFHPDKSRGKLVLDIVLVGIVQFSAMAWGCYQVYSQRPIAVVYGSERFISVAPEIMALQRKSASDMQVYSDDRPPYVYRREPATDREKQRQIGMLMQHGFHFESQAWLFTPFKEHLGQVFQRQKGLRGYIEDRLTPEWDAWSMGRPMTAYRFALYEGRYGNAVLIFSPEGAYQGYLTIKERFLPGIPPDDEASAEKAH